MSTQLMSVEQETAAFELVQRHAKMLSSSSLVPKEFQGNMANCAIGLNIAKRLGADPFMVIQNIDVIHGRPNFRASFLIAMVNASGRFTPLQFRMAGEGQSRSCVAHCQVRDSGEAVEGPEITMAMAKAEGWSTKAGSKWLTMPELMLRYRAAAFFARIYAPDITLGMHTSEEAYDMPAEPRMTTGRVVTPEPVAKLVNPYQEAVTEPAPLPEPVPQQSLEPVPQSPVEVSEETERKAIIDDIKATCHEEEVTLQTFGGRCKSAGLTAGNSTLRDIAIDGLRIIHENRLAIIRGTFGEEQA